VPGTTEGRRRRLSVRNLLLRVVVAAGLAYDTYVHLNLAEGFDVVRGSGLSQGDLFRVEAGLAGLAALLILLVPRRPVYLVAFLVAAGGVAAVVLYRYVDVGAIGPIPSMYEPIWYAEKTASAVAEGVAALAALVAAVVPARVSPPVPG